MESTKESAQNLKNSLLETGSLYAAFQITIFLMKMYRRNQARTVAIIDNMICFPSCCLMNGNFNVFVQFPSVGNFILTSQSMALCYYYQVW